MTTTTLRPGSAGWLRSRIENEVPLWDIAEELNWDIERVERRVRMFGIAPERYPKITAKKVRGRYR